MGGEIVGINTETFNGNKTAIKEASAILERVQNTATFRLTLPQMQVNMPLILWHFPQLY